MKAKTARREMKVAALPPPPTPRSWWPFAFAGAALIAVFWAYSTALRGPFLFDDNVFLMPGLNEPISHWVGRVRPALYFTFWLNAHFWKDDPYPYHVFNVLFHCVTGGLVFLIVRRLEEWAGIEPSLRGLLAAFASAVFLLHPVQAEAVAYIAGRSDAFSTMLEFAAFTIFLYRRSAVISWAAAAGVLLLFGLSLLSKEQTLALLAVFLLTDYWWNPGFSFRGMRANWKLYAPMAFGAVAGVAFFWRLITSAKTAGFGLKDFTWYQYFFTECRALLVYIGSFLLPVHLTLDWDFPVSKTLLDHGAIVGLIVLLALAGTAGHFRRRFPLASYGFFVYLLLMAPTSSILPIQDPVADRRLYGPMLGLLLIAVDLLSRVNLKRNTLAAACAAVALLFAAAAHARASLWADPVALFQDTVSKSPRKGRPHFHLASSYFDQQRYDLAVAEYEKTAQLQPVDYDLLVDWGLAYDAMGRMDDALAKLRLAATMDRTAHIYTQIAEVYAKRRHYAEALDALNTAQNIDGSFAPIYVYRGNVFFNTGQYLAAIGEYQKALSLDSNNAEALQNMQKARNTLLRAR
jgi:tetratricopeptide (TPR) repeat protein